MTLLSFHNRSAFLDAGAQILTYFLCVPNRAAAISGTKTAEVLITDPYSLLFKPPLLLLKEKKHSGFNVNMFFPISQLL